MDMNPASSATQMMDTIMGMPLVAELISISVTLGLASGGFFVVWRFVRQPFDIIQSQIRKNFTRHLYYHSDTPGYGKYITWLSDNNNLMIFNRNFKVSEFSEYNEELGKHVDVVRIVAGLGTTFFYTKQFGFVKVNRSQVEGNQTEKEVEQLSFTFYGRTITKIKAFAEAVNEHAATKRKKAQSIVYEMCGSHHSYQGVVKRVLPPISKQSQDVIEDIKFFVENEGFYRKRGIPYKRGYMLYGPPGTGKTSLIAFIANMFKLDVITTDGLGSFPDKAGPYILLIEDIDLTALAKKRDDLIEKNSDVEPKKKKKKKKAKNNQDVSVEDSDDMSVSEMMMFSGSELLRKFLNNIDGIKETSGVIVIITSNKPDSLDPAMIRPGRIDVKKYLGNYNTSEQLEHFNRFFSTNKTYNGTLRETSCAEIQNICITTPHDPDTAWSKIITNTERRVRQLKMPEELVDRRMAA